jgi:hypothetical protein
MQKRRKPFKMITYLGLLIDTEKMLIQIPDEKVQELLYFLNEASKRKKITLRKKTVQNDYMKPNSPWVDICQ